MQTQITKADIKADIKAEINLANIDTARIAKAYKRMSELTWSGEVIFSLVAYKASVECRCNADERQMLELQRERAGRENLIRAYR